MLRLEGIKIDDLKGDLIIRILSGSKKIAGQFLRWAQESREKDYRSPFRQITYRTTQEMEAVTGRIEDNSFLIDYKKSMETYIRDIETLLSKLG